MGFINRKTIAFLLSLIRKPGEMEERGNPTIRFHLYRGGDKQHRWRALARNHRVVCHNGEGLHNKTDLVDGLTKFIKAVEEGEFAIMIQEEEKDEA